MTKESIPVASNPFGAEKEPSQLQMTVDSLIRLDDYRRLLNEHLQNLPLPKADQGSGNYLAFETEDKHAIQAERSSFGTYSLKDGIPGKENDEDYIVYELKPDDTHPRGNRQGFLIHKVRSGGHTVETVFDFNDPGPAYSLETYRNSHVLDLQEDGLHIPSAEQNEWQHAWHDFQRKLGLNRKFFDFLNRLAYDKTLKQEDRAWANDFMRGHVRVEDADKFLRDVRDYWRAATGQALAEKDIPQFKERKRPADFVVPHQEVRTTIQQIANRLKSAVREIEERLNPDQGAYRTSARNRLDA